VIPVKYLKDNSGIIKENEGVYTNLGKNRSYFPVDNPTVDMQFGRLQNARHLMTFSAANFRVKCLAFVY
jgi:hypothetical protein